MATIDPENGNLILQIVYDGPAYSGKTESIRALGKLLGRKVVTPSEKDGRTLLFDWLAHEGGTRFGRPIQCRVVTVPGQPELYPRRQILLMAADTIVFVVDTTPEGFAGSQRALKELQSLLEARSRETPVILQLNKRDHEDALSEEEVLDALGSPSIRQHIRSVATQGDGIRESFVFAVSAAIRQLMKSGTFYSPGGEQFGTQELNFPGHEQLRGFLERLGPGGAPAGGHARVDDSQTTREIIAIVDEILK